MPTRRAFVVAATTLCGFHYITTAMAMWGAEHLGVSKPAHIPLRGTQPSAAAASPLAHTPNAWLAIADLAGLVVASSVSLASLNLSLMLNSVGFYQVQRQPN
jgi:hypothetical protein